MHLASALILWLLLTILSESLSSLPPEATNTNERVLPLSSPRGFQLEAPDSNRVIITWQTSLDTSARTLVWRCHPPNDSFAVIADLSPIFSSFVDSNVATSGFYRYIIQFYRGKQFSPFPDTLSIAFGFGSPDTLTATVINYRSAQLYWKAQYEFPVTYLVERQTGPKAPFKVITKLKDTKSSFLDSSLQTSIPYTYRVRASYLGCKSKCSPEVAVETKLPPPEGLQVETLTQEEAILLWKSPIDSLFSYLVERKKPYEAKFQRVGRTDALFWQDANLIVGSSYSYRVQLVSAGDNSEYSNPVSYTHRIPFEDLVYIPLGPFTMGSSKGDTNEAPEHQVYLSSYFIYKFEVTNLQFKAFCDSTRYPYPPDPGFLGLKNYLENYPYYPVVRINWFDAIRYCNWRSRMDGLESCYDEEGIFLPGRNGFHLPTEAQWEKAARGDSDTRLFPWGKALPRRKFKSLCNCRGKTVRGDNFPFCSPVGSFADGRSPYGVSDMAGNVWEWCNDWFDEDYYLSCPYRDPIGPNQRRMKVLRGGSWADDQGTLRLTNRGFNSPIFSYRTVGFRCARSSLQASIQGKPKKEEE